MWLLLLIGALLIGLLFYLSSLPGEFQVKRSKQVKAPIQQAFDHVRDFRNWPDWSPWLLHEPDATVSYSDTSGEVGGHYSWEGRHIGAGKMTLTEQNRPYTLQCELQFLRPFKSNSRVSFHFEEQEEGTLITWSMHGNMPFLFRMMIPRMITMIGKDFDIGLMRLACLLAERPVPSFDFIGSTTLPSLQAITHSFDCQAKDLSQQMKSGFNTLSAAMGPNEQPCAPGFALYTKADPEHDHFSGKIGLPVSASFNGALSPEPLPTSGAFYQVRYVGRYQYMDLAWYCAISHLRMLKVRQDKTRPYFEVYQFGPHNQPDDNLYVTDLFIPIR